MWTEGTLSSSLVPRSNMHHEHCKCEGICHSSSLLSREMSNSRVQTVGRDDDEGGKKKKITEGDFYIDVYCQH